MKNKLYIEKKSVASLGIAIVTVVLFLIAGTKVMASEVPLVEESTGIERSSGISMDEVRKQKESCQSVIGNEESLLGGDEVQFYLNDYPDTKEGYRGYDVIIIDELGERLSLQMIIRDLTTGLFMVYDPHNEEQANTFFNKFKVYQFEEGDFYSPNILLKFNQDDPETETNDFLVATLTEMPRDGWMSESEIPYSRKDGHIGYYAVDEKTYYPEDNGMSFSEANEYYPKDSSSSSSSRSSSSSSSSSSSKSSSSSSSEKDSSSSSSSRSSSSSSSSSSSKSSSSSSSEKDSSSSSSKSSSSSSSRNTISGDLVVKQFSIDGIDFEIEYSREVTYNGKKHIAVGSKTNSKTTADVIVKISANGRELDPSSYKVRFRNNITGLRKTPTFKISLGSGYTRQEKKTLSRMNFEFGIKSLQVEAENFLAKKPIVISGASIQKLKLCYRMPDGKIVSIKNKDLSYEIIDDQIRLTVRGNLFGTVMIPIRKLQ